MLVCSPTLFFQIRLFHQDDLPALISLFRQTVWNINCRDYSPAQLAAWAPDKIDEKQWLSSLLRHHTLIAQLPGGTIVGFGDISSSGYLDRLYVHKDFQHKHIASTLVASLELYASKQGCTQIETHASITALPFFLSKGYHIIKQQQVMRFGQPLTNYVMQKEMPPVRSSRSGI